MFKCAIFDFDGTLADTNAGIVATFRKTVESLSIPCPSDEKISSTIGLALGDNFRMSLPGISEEMVEKCVTTYRRIFDEIALPGIYAFDGVVDTLNTLKNNGIRLAIATSRSHRSLSMICESLGLSDTFETIVAADDVVNHKPAPDAVLMNLEALGVDAGDALVIGDTVFDLQMGQAAGCKVCGVTWGNHPRARLEEAAPDYIIDSMQELLPLFGI